MRLVSAIHGANGNARSVEKANPGMSFGVDLYKNLVIMLNFLPHSANRTEYEEVTWMVSNLCDLGALGNDGHVHLSDVLFLFDNSCNPSLQLSPPRAGPIHHERLDKAVARENGGGY